MAADTAAPGMAGDPSRRASGFAVAALGLLLVTRASAVLMVGARGQLPFIVALCVLPLLYALPMTRPVLARHRWYLLAVQGVLTWVPFAIFGSSWSVGVGGLLAGLVLLTVAAPLSWLLAGALLAAEAVVRVAVTGLPVAPAWFAVVWVVTYHVDDALAFFGLVRLAQLVGELHQARGQAADLAVTGERLRRPRRCRQRSGSACPASRR